jgi:hypothetical protein
MRRTSTAQKLIHISHNKNHTVTEWTSIRWHWFRFNNSMLLNIPLVSMLPLQLMMITHMLVERREGSLNRHSPPSKPYSNRFFFLFFSFIFNCFPYEWSSIKLINNAASKIPVCVSVTMDLAMDALEKSLSNQNLRWYIEAWYRKPGIRHHHRCFHSSSIFPNTTIAASIPLPCFSEAGTIGDVT